MTSSESAKRHIHKGGGKALTCLKTGYSFWSLYWQPETRSNFTEKKLQLKDPEQ